MCDSLCLCLVILKEFAMFVNFVGVEFGYMQVKNNKRAETSLAKAAHFPNIARILNLESQHCHPNHPKDLINCSLYHC